MAKYPVFARAITIDSTNKVIRYKKNGGAAASATLTEGTYYLFGDGTIAGDLCKAIKDALTSAFAGIDIRYFSYLGAGAQSGQVSFNTGSADTLQILSSASGTTFDLRLVGLPDADSSIDTGFLGSLTPSATWLPNQPQVIHDAMSPVANATTHETPSGRGFVFVVGDAKHGRMQQFRFISAERTWLEYTTADSYRAWESFWELIRRGEPFRYYRGTGTDTLATLTAADLVDTLRLWGDALRFAFPALQRSGPSVFDWEIEMRRVV